jgi:hypothetical protein
MPHLEFTVDGPPVSHQTRDKANLNAWKGVIYNFHEGEHASLDDDNMVKPIRDALNGLIYDDDSQITYSETRHINIDAPIKIRRASAIVLAAFRKGDEFLYVRIEDLPDFIQLPQ